MAEIGTFSQIPMIASRLIVMVPEQFYRAESYISRGPLSLIAKDHPSSVIYYNFNSDIHIKQKVLYNLTFYKYARHHGDQTYRDILNPNTSNDYPKIISEMRNRYNKSIVLASILSLDDTTFPDVVLRSGLSPKEANQALKGLFNENSIKKLSNGIYMSINGYSDNLLSSFNTTALSRAKAKLIAGY